MEAVIHQNAFATSSSSMLAVPAGPAALNFRKSKIHLVGHHAVLPRVEHIEVRLPTVA